MRSFSWTAGFSEQSALAGRADQSVNIEDEEGPGARTGSRTESSPTPHIASCAAGGKIDPAAGRGSRSSLHYDPYQNLLCVVRGAKRVRLYSPAMTRNLYPMPVYGESPNHSAVDVAAPDQMLHPSYAAAQQQELVADVQVATYKHWHPDKWTASWPGP